MPFYVSMGRSSLTSLSTNPSPYHYVSTDGNSVWKGPRKICCFCSLAIVFPALLISIPLLMRFVLYGTSQHLINPSDMKILDKRISTTWCQVCGDPVIVAVGETIRINTSFTAYMSEGEPSVIDTPMHYSLDRNLIIPDDHKEYWGFYLLKGSKFKIRTCSRWKGGTLLIVQGENHLEHCAYIGEADSAGDSDQISGSNSIELLNNEIMRQTRNHRTYSQEEMSLILTKIRHYVKSHPNNHGKLKKNLKNFLLLQEATNEVNARDTAKDILTTLQEASDHINGFTVTRENATNALNISLSDTEMMTLLKTSIETGTIKRTRRQAEVRKRTESGENGAFEDESPDDDNNDDPNNSINDTDTEGISGIHPRFRFLSSSTTKRPSTPPSIWAREHGHHVGVFNETKDPNDGSNSESESSFSSSEEALLKCEGVLATFDILPDNNCEAEGLYDDLQLYPSGNALRIPSADLGSTYSIPFYEDTVNVSGYYYFIFGSENEKRDNFIRAKFELDKMEYELPAEPIVNCTNVKECHVDFRFASKQKVIVKIPAPSPPHHRDSYTWDQIFVAETECHPRTHLYMIFALMVPVVILLCAFQ